MTEFSNVPSELVNNIEEIIDTSEEIKKYNIAMILETARASILISSNDSKTGKDFLSSAKDIKAYNYKIVSTTNNLIKAINTYTSKVDYQLKDYNELFQKSFNIIDIMNKKTNAILSLIKEYKIIMKIFYSKIFILNRENMILAK